MRSIPFLLLVALFVAPTPGCGGTDDPSGECSCEGKECGPDGCGGVCGQCGEGFACMLDTFTCRSTSCGCDGKSCGDDGCGGSCGDCGPGQVCNPFLFRCSTGCVPDCTGRQCGDDGCGGSCGDCGADFDCDDGTCGPKAACDDGRKNGGETGTDCGGPCPNCPVGQGCAGDADCKSGRCDAGTCAVSLACTNGDVDPGETDRDCGGPTCDPCAVGLVCKDPGDCLSLSCQFGRCEKPSCTDGLKNQGEGDTDCGGPCPDCADGRRCLVPGDCAGGACEGGVCCTPNECGQCSDSPVEICNGQDDDCNGATDEGMGEEGPACPKTAGVCAGARATCRGLAGWQCDDATYRNRDERYEPEETACDNVDNDCDGSKDEGLRNACGSCGPAPVEACNGRDDDCNGKTDDLAACAACTSAAPVKLATAAKNWGFSVTRTGDVAVVGDTAFAVVRPEAYQNARNRLYRLDDGALSKETILSGVSTVSPSAILGGDGDLLLAGTDEHCVGGTVCVVTPMAKLFRLALDGTVKSQVLLSDAASAGGFPLARAGQTIAAMITNRDGDDLFGTIQEEAWVASGGSSCKSDSYGRSLVLRPDGSAFVTCHLPPVGGGAGVQVTVEEINGDDVLLEGRASDKSTLRAAPDGTLYLVYPRDGTVWLRTLPPGQDGSWSEAEAVGAGSAPSVAVDASGRPVVLMVDGTAGLAVATRNAGAWSRATVHTSTVPGERLKETSLAIDAAGRLHLAFFGWTTDRSGYLADEFFWYRMACPTL